MRVVDVHRNDEVPQTEDGRNAKRFQHICFHDGRERVVSVSRLHKLHKFEEDGIAVEVVGFFWRILGFPCIGEGNEKIYRAVCEPLTGTCSIQLEHIQVDVTSKDSQHLLSGIFLFLFESVRRYSREEGFSPNLVVRQEFL